MELHIAKKLFLIILLSMVVVGCTTFQQFQIPDNVMEHVESLSVPLHFGEQWKKHSSLTLIIQEKACHLLVDTAFDGTIGLKPKIIDTLALPVIGRTTYRDAEGKTYHGRQVLLPTAQLGILTLSNIPAQEDLFGPEEFDGHIGRGVLQNFNLLIDYRNKLLTFYKKTHLPEFLHEPEWFTAPLNEKMQITIEMMPSATPYVVGLDTGSNAFAIPQTSDLATSIVNTYGITEENTIINQRNGMTVYRYVLDNFSIDGYPLGGMEIILADMAKYMGNGILGYDFFYNNLVYLDFHNRRLYLKKSTGS